MYAKKKKTPLGNATTFCFLCCFLLLQWYSWKLDHEKFYQDSNQENMRRMIWYENYRLISQHNSAANHSYALELNEFADLVSIYISLVLN